MGQNVGFPFSLSSEKVSGKHLLSVPENALSPALFHRPHPPVALPIGNFRRHKNKINAVNI